MDPESEYGPAPPEAAIVAHLNSTPDGIGLFFMLMCVLSLIGIVLVMSMMTWQVRTDQCRRNQTSMCVGRRPTMIKCRSRPAAHKHNSIRHK